MPTKTTMPLYHEVIGLPDSIIEPRGRAYLSPSGHALERAQADEYLLEEETSLAIPNSITFSDETIFEIEVLDGEITKICCRVNYDQTRDLGIALVGDGSICDPTDPYTVKTVWVNSVDDTHDTLDISQYDVPNQV